MSAPPASSSPPSSTSTDGPGSPVSSVPSVSSEQVANDVAASMPSPYCPGRTIASCPSSAARELEQDIIEQAEQGMSRTEIETALVERFGKEVMGQAYSSEVFLGVAAAALLAVVVGAYVVRTWLRRPTESTETQQGAGASPGSAISPAELDDLEEALDQLDGF